LICVGAIFQHLGRGPRRGRFGLKSTFFFDHLAVAIEAVDVSLAVLLDDARVDPVRVGGFAVNEGWSGEREIVVVE